MDGDTMSFFAAVDTDGNELMSSYAADDDQARRLIREYLVGDGQYDRLERWAENGYSVKLLENVI
jgi:hypothetical protein